MLPAIPASRADAAPSSLSDFPLRFKPDRLLGVYRIPSELLGMAVRGCKSRRRRLPPSSEQATETHIPPTPSRSEVAFMVRGRPHKCPYCEANTSVASVSRYNKAAQGRIWHYNSTDYARLLSDGLNRSNPSGILHLRMQMKERVDL